MDNKKNAIKSSSKNQKNGNTDYPTIISMFKGISVAYGITCIIFIAYGILITYTNVSFDNLPVVALVTTALSSAIVGYDWAICTNKKGLIIGTLAGITYVLLLFAISFLANNSFEFGFSKLVTFFVGVLAGGIGGVFGANFSN